MRGHCSRAYWFYSREEGLNEIMLDTRAPCIYRLSAAVLSAVLGIPDNNMAGE